MLLTPDHVPGDEPLARQRALRRLRRTAELGRRRRGSSDGGSPCAASRAEDAAMHARLRAAGGRRPRLRPGGGPGAAARCASWPTLLEKRGVEVKYAIHPVAGRMPGHMNVLLAEANVPYDQLLRHGRHQPRVRADRRGAGDRRERRREPRRAHGPVVSPIYGMPILNVDQAQSVIVLKRSMSAGFAGIENDLFYNPTARRCSSATPRGRCRASWRPSRRCRPPAAGRTGSPPAIHRYEEELLRDGIAKRAPIA